LIALSMAARAAMPASSDWQILHVLNRLAFGPTNLAARSGPRERPVSALAGHSPVDNDECWLAQPSSGERERDRYPPEQQPLTC
jgi:hypothetical protein